MPIVRDSRRQLYLPPPLKKKSERGPLPLVLRYRLLPSQYKDTKGRSWKKTLLRAQSRWLSPGRFIWLPMEALGSASP